jgi:hypothetical protein
MVQFTRDGGPYIVTASFLYNRGEGGNDAAIKAVGPPVKLATLAYGYRSRGGDWPESKPEDYEALTRLTKLVFGFQKLPSGQRRRDAIDRLPLVVRWRKQAAVAVRKAKKAAAASAVKAAKARKARERLKQLAIRKIARNPKARAINAYFRRHSDAFGCQRAHVKRLVGFLLGVSFPGDSDD